MRRGIILIALLATACADDTPSDVADLFAAFDRVMGGCPDRVWPGYTWTDAQVLLLDEADAQAWIWSDASRGRSRGPIAASTLPRELQAFSLFTVVSWDGRRTLGINRARAAELEALYADGAAPYTHSIAFHEGFHFLGGQDDFDPAGQPIRDPVWPEDAAARFIRSEMIGELGYALLGGPGNPLGRARAWRDLFEREHVRERQDLEWIDVTEGTAQYVETISIALANTDCAAGEERLLDQARKHFTAFFPPSHLRRDIEGYTLGGLAGMLLRSRNGQGFEVDAKRRPLFELLLDDVPQDVELDLEDPDLVMRREVAEDEIDLHNREAELELMPVVEAWTSTVANVRLVVTPEVLAGSFSYRGGFFVRDAARLHVLVAMSLEARSPDGRGAGEVVELGGVSLDTTPCGRGGFGFAIPRVVVPDGERISISMPGLTMTDFAAERIEEWICLR